MSRLFDTSGPIKSVSDFAGIEVIEHPMVPPGQFYAIATRNPIDLPPEWETMTENEKFTYLVLHGAIVAVHSIEALKPKT